MTAVADGRKQAAARDSRLSHMLPQSSAYSQLRKMSSANHMSVAAAHAGSTVSVGSSSQAHYQTLNQKQSVPHIKRKETSTTNTQRGHSRKRPTILQHS